MKNTLYPPMPMLCYDYDHYTFKKILTVATIGGKRRSDRILIREITKWRRFGLHSNIEYGLNLISCFIIIGYFTLCIVAK